MRNGGDAPKVEDGRKLEKVGIAAAGYIAVREEGEEKEACESDASAGGEMRLKALS